MLTSASPSTPNHEENHADAIRPTRTLLDQGRRAMGPAKAAVNKVTAAQQKANQIADEQGWPRSPPAVHGSPQVACPRRSPRVTDQSHVPVMMLPSQI
ncbi:hypothetical protein GCM10012275_60350 [Longimycelium tulufanense]|uniref:Uncharacterized protein n=1 Tax=Longimycelium tulufanense TaxID=907463 RepID=A0A8J3CEA2_9PSEU|nr:hypothetical protein GCM10012275_60350 [Longimycelium tulufanense]